MIKILLKEKIKYKKRKYQGSNGCSLKKKKIAQNKFEILKKKAKERERDREYHISPQFQKQI